MVGGLMSPARSRFSPRNNSLHPKPVNNSSASLYPAAPRVKRPDDLRSHRKETQSNPTKSTDRPSRTSRSQQTEPQNPNKKKLETNHSTPKSAAKIIAKSSPSSSSSSHTPSKNNANVNGAVGSGSRSHANSSAAKDQQRLKNANLNHSHSDALHSEVRHLFHRLSMEGKDIYESLGSKTKKEESSKTNNGARIFEIYKEIASHRQGNSPITSYLTKLKELWEELATYNIDHIEREKVVQFLVGLHDSYSTICTQIIVTNPFPTLEEAFVVIIREETRREFLLSLENIAAKANNWVPQNANNSKINNGDSNISNEQIGDNLDDQQVDQNEATAFTIEPVRC